VRWHDAALDGRGTRVGRNRGVRLVAYSQIPAPAPQETRAQTSLRTPDRYRSAAVVQCELAAGGREVLGTYQIPGSRRRRTRPA